MTQDEPMPVFKWKWQRILAAFVTGRTWHALEAGPALRTTCLHSDIAGLEARGLRFDHTPETVAGYDGQATRVIRYRLRPESYPQARRLLSLPEPAGCDPEAYRRASGG